MCSVRAQDRATLDMLVKKGIITQAEADEAAKSAAVVVNPRTEAVKKLTIGGLLQIQYDWLNTHDQAAGATQPPAVNQFMVRRANIDTAANLGNGWIGQLGLNFGSRPVSPAPPETGITQRRIRKAIISKTVDGFGVATVGYQKVSWGQEENTSSSKLKTIERSVVTFFFDGTYGGPTNGRLGYGSHHTGVFWDGTVPTLTGFTYGGAVTDGIQGISVANPGRRRTRLVYNKFAYWTYAGYEGKYTGLDYAVGVNLGYDSEANSANSPIGLPAQTSAAYGYNPYVTFVYDRLTISSEFMQTVVESGRSNADGDTSNAVPYGFIVAPSYLLTRQWELATRFSYLDTNGRGTRINPVDRNAQNTFDTRGFDDAWAVYCGFNFYIQGTAIELSAGYEYTQFLGRQTFPGGPFNGPGANVSGVYLS
ncbi:MAG: porin [Opitutales bacterium]